MPIGGDIPAWGYSRLMVDQGAKPYDVDRLVWEVAGDVPAYRVDQGHRGQPPQVDNYAVLKCSLRRSQSVARKAAQQLHQLRASAGLGGKDDGTLNGGETFGVPHLADQVALAEYVEVAQAATTVVRAPLGIRA